jgi:hypothetical protein
MTVFTYEGQKYELPDGTSPAEAMSKIRTYLEKNPRQSGSDVPVDPADEGVLQEFGEGVVGGLIEAGSGLAELAALVPDAINDTNYSRRVTEAKNQLKDDLGIDPTGLTGEITQALVQFAVPGLGAVGAASKLAKLRNLSRTTTALTGIGAAGVIDGMVASDGTTTIGDFVGRGYTMTSKDIGLSGREEAARRFGNRLKFAAEAAGVTASLPVIFKTVGVLGKEAVEATTEFGDTVGLNAIIAKGGEATNRIVQKATSGGTPMSEALDQILGRLRSRGFLPANAFEKRSKIVGDIEQQVTKASRIAKRIDRSINQAFKGSKNDYAEFRNILTEGSGLDKVEVGNLFYGFLTRDPGFIDGAKREASRLGKEIDVTRNEDLVQFLPDFMQKQALVARRQIDRLTSSIASSPFVQSGILPDIKQIIDEQLSQFIRRTYAAFEDPNWFKTDLFKESYDNAIKFYEENPDVALDMYRRFVSKLDVDDFTTGVGINARVRPEYAKQIVDQFVENYKKPARPNAQDGTVDRVVRDRLRTSMLTKKPLDQPVLRAVLGEIRDPIDAFMSTVTDLASFRATDSYYNYLARQFLDPDNPSKVGDEIISDETFKSIPDKSPLKKQYKVLGTKPNVVDGEITNLDKIGDIQYGALTGSYAKHGFTSRIGEKIGGSMYSELTQLTLARGTPGDFLYRMSYGNFLRAKGQVQFAKTVLSPITQVRNVTSSALFAMAQGNLGRGGNLGESIQTVFSSIHRLDDVQRELFYGKLQRLGVVGTQTQIKEMDKLIEEGIGGSLKGHIDEMGVNITRDKGLIRRTLGRNKLGQLIDNAAVKPLKGASDLAKSWYQGGDDIWKIYNFQFERQKVINAMGDANNAEQYARQMGFDDLDSYAADIVKNVVPNYERVPEAIKLLRKAPLGNFIAFPAEIIRTSANTLSYAAKELGTSASAFKNLSPEAAEAAASKIREIGMRRLLGFMGTVGVAGPAVQGIGMYALGVGQEQMDALQRRVANWSRASTLVPTSVKKGKDNKNYVTGYVDFSYTNPYDYWMRPARAIMKAHREGVLNQYDTDKFLTSALVDVTHELASPFLEDSILFEKLADVSERGRGGRTKTGAVIYNKGSGDFKVDTTYEQWTKSIAHVLGAFTPGIIEQTAGTIGAKAELGGEVGFVPGRIATALFSPDGRDARGNVRQIEEEVASILTGLREVDVKSDKIVQYGGYQYQRSVSSAAQIFNRAARVEQALNPDNILSVYEKANQVLFREQNRMFGMIKDMRTLGMSDQEIRKTLKKAKVGNVNKLMRGIFTPFTPSEEVKKQARKNVREFGGEFPMREIFARRRDFMRLPLTGEDLLSKADGGSVDLETDNNPIVKQDAARSRIPDTISDDFLKTPRTQGSAASATPPAEAQLAGAVPAPSAAPATFPAQPPRPLNIGPTTLPDPRDQELAQRLRQA